MKYMSAHSARLRVKGSLLRQEPEINEVLRLSCIAGGDEKDEFKG